MTPLLTRLRSMAGANSGHYECCLSIQEVREIITKLEGGPWQPIETAPKDGDILVACVFQDGSCQQAVALWYRDCWASLDRTMVILDPQPTHWMPLPEPPAAPPLSSPAEIASFIDSMGTPKRIEG